MSTDQAGPVGESSDGDVCDQTAGGHDKSTSQSRSRTPVAEPYQADDQPDGTGEYHGQDTRGEQHHTDTEPTREDVANRAVTSERLGYPGTAIEHPYRTQQGHQASDGRGK